MNGQGQGQAWEVTTLGHWFLTGWRQLIDSDHDLTSSEIAVLQAYAFRASSKRVVYASAARIASDTRMTRTGVSGIRDRLITRGYLLEEEVRLYRTRTFRVCLAPPKPPPEPELEPVRDANPVGTPDPQGGGSEMPTPLASDANPVGVDANPVGTIPHRSPKPPSKTGSSLGLDPPHPQQPQGDKMQEGLPGFGQPKPKPTKAERLAADILKVCDFWHAQWELRTAALVRAGTVTGKAPGHPRKRVTDSKQVNAALRIDGHALEDLVLMVEWAFWGDGFHARFLRGESDRGPTVYLGLANLFARKDAKLDQKIEKARQWRDRGKPRHERHVEGEWKPEGPVPQGSAIPAGFSL